MPVSLHEGFIPITDIVPPMRSLGERAQQFEVESTKKANRGVSCKDGCAACCRMMIPLSPPEAFELLDAVNDLPASHRERVLSRINNIQSKLRESKLGDALEHLAYSSQQFTDEELEPLNRAYYSLRLPCVFLEHESCSIYEHRPAACRELLVTSPAELCQDMIRNPIDALSIPLRISTTLAKLWANLMGGPIRLIPLPLAFDWATNHTNQRKQTWATKELFKNAVTVAGDFLRQFFQECRLPK